MRGSDSFDFIFEIKSEALLGMSAGVDASGFWS